MLRKLLCATVLFFTGLSTAWAGSLYLGPEIVYQALAVNDIGYNGVSPRFSLGYEDMFTQYIYGAAEIFTSPTTATIYNNPNNFGSLRITYSYGASILPGISFDGTIIGYGRFGYIRTRFDNLGKVEGGVQYGLGLRWVLTDLWSARVEYSYTKYQNIAPIGHPDMNSYMLGLTYRFWC